MDNITNKIARGQFGKADLPFEINIWDLEESYRKIRELSFQQKVEYGGCIVLAGKRLVLSHPVEGWSEGVNPRCAPSDHDAYVGFAHVHLPDQDGNPYMGFSARDYRATLADGDNLALVSNGYEAYALARVSGRTKPAQVISGHIFKEWEQLYERQINTARRKKTRLNEALWGANQEVCQQLGFAFYGGDWGRPLQLLFKPA